MWYLMFVCFKFIFLAYFWLAGFILRDNLLIIFSKLPVCEFVKINALSLTQFLPERGNYIDGHHDNILYESYVLRSQFTAFFLFAFT